jgi:hypothetical protein
MDIDSAIPEHQRATLAPAGKLGDEVRQRGQLDVYSQALLQSRKLAQQLIGLGLEAQVNIDHRLTPTLEDRGRTTRQIDPNWTASDLSELAGERTNARLINRRKHAPPLARSSPRDRQARYSDCGHPGRSP